MGRDEPGVRHRRRIVFTTFGSLGDLYPYLAVARGLQARGHEAVIATTGRFRENVEAAGVGFHAVRPDGPDINTDREAMRRVMDPRYGGEYVIREVVIPAVRESYADTLAAARGADLLVSHVLTYATRLVAEKEGIPWASTFLQPLCFFSTYDPPVLAPLPFLAKLRFLGPSFHRMLFGLAERMCRPWVAPWHELRAEVGLPKVSDNPAFRGLCSPSLVLAMFSPAFADRQPDWPTQTVLTGFPFPEPGVGPGMPADLHRFLEAGPPPVVFTLGSSGMLAGGSFYEASAAAAGRLGRRAVLIVGKDPANRPTSLPAGVAAFEYAPFGELFPRAATVVHAGGIGTTALAIRSGRPMLIVPLSHDQFDNAARVERLGIGSSLSMRRYTPARVAARLRSLLDRQSYAERSSRIGELVRREDGTRAACDALERMVSVRPRTAVVE